MNKRQITEAMKEGRSITLIYAPGRDPLTPMGFGYVLSDQPHHWRTVRDEGNRVIGRELVEGQATGTPHYPIAYCRAYAFEQGETPTWSVILEPGRNMVNQTIDQWRERTEERRAERRKRDAEMRAKLDANRPLVKQVEHVLASLGVKTASQQPREGRTLTPWERSLILSRGGEASLSFTVDQLLLMLTRARDLGSVFQGFPNVAEPKGNPDQLTICEEVS